MCWNKWSSPPPSLRYVRDLASTGDTACVETLSIFHIKFFLCALCVISNALQNTYRFHFVETEYAVAYFCAVVNRWFHWSHYSSVRVWCSGNVPADRRDGIIITLRKRLQERLWQLLPNFPSINSWKGICPRSSCLHSTTVEPMTSPTTVWFYCLPIHNRRHPRFTSSFRDASRIWVSYHRCVPWRQGGLRFCWSVVVWKVIRSLVCWRSSYTLWSVPVVKLRGNVGERRSLPLFKGERRAASSDGRDRWNIQNREALYRSVECPKGEASWPSDQGFCPWTRHPTGASPPGPHYSLALPRSP